MPKSVGMSAWSASPPPGESVDQLCEMVHKGPRADVDQGLCSYGLPCQESGLPCQLSS